MAPKKTSAFEEVISSSDSPNNDEKVSGEAKSESSKVSAVARKTPIHPPTMVMVKEALKELDSRKGVSSQAIRSYVKEKYPSLDLVRLKYMIRKALNKGIENGVLVRPPNSTANGAQGRFRLAVRGKELKRKATENTDKVKELKRKATENTDPNVEKAAKGGAKKTKEKEAVAKKITTAKKQNQKKTSEDAKSKNVAGGSKVAPAKKPKAKRPAEEGAAEDQPKPKALKTTKAGEGAAKKGEGAAKKGEGAAKKGEGAAKKGEGAAKKGEGAAKKGEGAAKKGKASKKPAEGDGGDTVVPVARTTGKRGKKAAAE